ncbi:MAG: sugar dehydrogenase complex small subunit [Polyangiaceae bacterium]
MTAPTNDPVDTFARLSAVLTGFTLATIKPGLDPVNLSKTYYDFVNAKSATTLAQLLAAYLENQSQPAQQLANLLLETQAKTPSARAALAQSIVRMWYLGSWYAPGDSQPTQVVSSQAYVGGLVWKAAQTHPMGYSEFTFGYWSKQPPPLNEFGVDVPPQASGGKS